MTAHTLPPTWEPSAWMRGRLAALERKAWRAVSADRDPASCVVIAALTRHELPGTWQDRTCDRCRAYVPPGESLHMLSHLVRPWLVVTGGLCDGCAAAEGVRHD